MDRKPKFYCESCGEEVKENDRVCMHCGKFFSSVKCPSCGFSGDSKAFHRGCPICGYAVYERESGRDMKKTDERGASADPLPVWMYLVSLLLLAAAVAVILLRR